MLNPRNITREFFKVNLDRHDLDKCKNNKDLKVSLVLFTEINLAK